MTLLETLLAVILALGAFALIIYFRLRENRYLQKKTKEVMSKELRKEIEQEKNEALRKKEKFEKILKDFSGQ